MPLVAAPNLNILLQEREQLNDTVWSNEVDAQEHERYFIRLWDSLRASEDAYTVAPRFKFGSVKIGTPGSVDDHEHGIRILTTEDTGHQMSWKDWMGLLGKLKSEGYELTMSEFHHSQFEHSLGQLAQSLVSFKLYVDNAGKDMRYVVSGNLKVEWEPQKNSQGIMNRV